MTTTAAPNDAVLSLGKVLDRLKSTAPPLFLSPSPQLAGSARSASQHIFNLLKPYAPKSPFDSLLCDGFDAEQIWQQIDLQTQPLLSSLRRDVKRFERDEDQIRGFFQVERESVELERESEEVERESEGFDELELERESEEEEEEEEGESEELERESEEVRDGDGEGEGEGVEDKFLKIKELEEYMEDDEAREYGVKNTKKKRNGEDDEEDEEDDEEEEDDDELGLLGVDVGEDDEDDIRFN